MHIVLAWRGKIDYRRYLSVMYARIMRIVWVMVLVDVLVWAQVGAVRGRAGIPPSPPVPCGRWWWFRLAG
jgi:hypothetical protein